MSRFLPPLFLTVLLLAGWELACRLLHVPPWFLPPPSAVAAALIERAPLLAASAAATFWMALQALAVAALLGGGLALAVSLSRPAEQADGDILESHLRQLRTVSGSSGCVCGIADRPRDRSHVVKLPRNSPSGVRSGI